MAVLPKLWEVKDHVLGIFGLSLKCVSSSMEINILVYTLSSDTGPLNLGLDIGQFQSATNIPEH